MIIASTNYNDQLREVCKEIALQIDLAEQARGIWDFISDNAEAINDEKFGACLGLFQRMALNETILAIFRIFDENIKTASLMTALNIMKSSDLLKRDPFVQYLSDTSGNFNKWSNLADQDLLIEGAELVRDSQPKHNLKHIKCIRHEQIAHNALTKKQVNIWEADFDACLNWTKDFVKMTAKAFGTHGMPARAHSPNISLRKLCHRAGIIIDPLFSQTS